MSTPVSGDIIEDEGFVVLFEGDCKEGICITRRGDEVEKDRQFAMCKGPFEHVGYKEGKRPGQIVYLFKHFGFVTSFEYLSEADAYIRKFYGWESDK